MTISRWIYLPLIFAVFWIALYGLGGHISTVSDLIFYFCLGASMGLIIQGWSYFKIRKNAAANIEEAQKVRQDRTITLMQNIENAYDLCIDAISSPNRIRLTSSDRTKKIIEARSTMNWDTFGTRLHLKLVKVNNHMTEVRITTSPIPKTALVDYGNAYLLVEELISCLRENDKEISSKTLTQGIEMINDAVVRPLDIEATHTKRKK